MAKKTKSSVNYLEDLLNDPFWKLDDNRKKTRTPSKWTGFTDEEIGGMYEPFQIDKKKSVRDQLLSLNHRDMTQTVFLDDTVEEQQHDLAIDYFNMANDRLSDKDYMLAAFYLQKSYYLTRYSEYKEQFENINIFLDKTDPDTERLFFKEQIKWKLNSSLISNKIRNSNTVINNSKINLIQYLKNNSDIQNYKITKFNLSEPKIKVSCVKLKENPKWLRKFPEHHGSYLVFKIKEDLINNKECLVTNHKIPVLLRRLGK